MPFHVKCFVICFEQPLHHPSRCKDMVQEIIHRVVVLESLCLLFLPITALTVENNNWAFQYRRTRDIANVR